MVMVNKLYSDSEVRVYYILAETHEFHFRLSIYRKYFDGEFHRIIREGLSYDEI